MAFYELRQYKVLPGKIDEWVRIMEQEIIPFQVSKGMVICGSFRGETDDSVYVWLRRFESEAEREAQYKAVYESDHWKNEIAPRVPECERQPKRALPRRRRNRARHGSAHRLRSWRACDSRRG